MKIMLGFGAFIFFATSEIAQSGKPVRVRVVYDKADPSSSSVAPMLLRLFAAQPKLFIVADGEDKDLAIVSDCYRETLNDAYSCFYVATKWIGSTQALLGAAVVVQKSAEQAANSLFADILQDVVERWNSTDRQMLINELETCLMLTESSCAVPDPLVAELKTKSINLSQYMRKGGLKH
jgi:hypothetical protein